jgi:glycine cleavage system aminomethyltransferase T
MSSKEVNYHDSKIRVSRYGYIGEDGFEMSVPNKLALELAEVLTNTRDNHD